MERDPTTITIRLAYINFNSHAHVERDIIQVLVLVHIIISTHTLTWSVTLSDCLNDGEEVISTHTLTWSVTALFFSGEK